MLVIISLGLGILCLLASLGLHTLSRTGQPTATAAFFTLALAFLAAACVLPVEPGLWNQPPVCRVHSGE